jgi:hypothetical protein
MSIDGSTTWLLLCYGLGAPHWPGGRGRKAAGSGFAVGWMPHSARRPRFGDRFAVDRAGTRRLMRARDSDNEAPETGISDEAREDRARAEREVAERRREQSSPDPHHELANPVDEPDPTEYPDPYERRSDPRAPYAPEGRAESEHDVERGPTPRDRSTSDPPPPRNIDRAREGEGDEP